MSGKKQDHKFLHALELVGASVGGALIGGVVGGATAGKMGVSHIESRVANAQTSVVSGIERMKADLASRMK